jgi:hypothetical protein
MGYGSTWQLADDPSSFPPAKPPVQRDTIQYSNVDVVNGQSRGCVTRSNNPNFINPIAFDKNKLMVIDAANSYIEPDNQLGAGL